MRPTTLGRLTIALAAILAVTPAYSQIYKWVDARGVTNYSGQPPVDPKAAEKVAIVEDKVSVYTPDPALLRAVEAFRQGANRAAYDRISIPETPRPQVIVINNQIPLSAYESDPGYYPVWAAGVRPPFGQRFPKLTQTTLQPGAIAGNVVGMDGYIPGNSAAASVHGSAPAPRRAHAAPSMRGSWLK